MVEKLEKKDVDILRETIARKRAENQLIINVQTPEAKKTIRTNELVIGVYQRLVKVSEERANV